MFCGNLGNNIKTLLSPYGMTYKHKSGNLGKPIGESWGVIWGCENLGEIFGGGGCEDLFLGGEVGLENEEGFIATLHLEDN